MGRRSHGQRITQTQRRVLAEKLRELLMREPNLSRDELVKRTGAPFDMCNFMKRRMKEEREAFERARGENPLMEAGHA
ncbi:MAG: hypothetical protein EPN91_08415 [Salinibacterium sp.]|nr:MAG: hypothetical protein EPN91_08415 [Salinibacterium sp.]